LFSIDILGQGVSLYQQFNGKYDFTFVGNTLNPEENTFMPSPQINTSSQATLNLGSNDQIEKAYLYWAGCGPGDYEVKLNGTTILPDRFFNYQTITDNVYDYFSAFADVTTQIQSTGNGQYTLSDLDLNEWISYYFTRRSNFGGWAIIVIYKNSSLPENQINIYDGLDGVPNEINITLTNLNVIDNLNAKIGFIAWEGDKNIQVGESLQINGTTIGNLPLNPPANAFNGTNTFTNSSDLYNMDLDVYDIQNNIQIGNTSAAIKLTSGQDFVLINAVITKLNSQLPDAQIAIDSITMECNSREVHVNYTVSNPNGTKALPAQVPIAIYLNGVLIQTTQTETVIQINGFEAGTLLVTIPNDALSPFDIKIVVDDDGTSNGILIELNEDNNVDQQNTQLFTAEPLPTMPDVISCNDGLGFGVFDLTENQNSIRQNPADVVTFFTTLDDLTTGTNPINSVSSYQAASTPMTLFVKVANGNCYQVTSFILRTKKCPPIIYNYVSSNNDGINDTFYIKRLRDVFVNFRISIFNRWGTLVWKGNNATPDWDGYANSEALISHTLVVDGTYFYLLELNDPDYTKPFSGYLFLNK